MPDYIDQSIEQTTVFETAVPWMYLDTRGFVTAGIGKMLPTSAAAVMLPFLDPDGESATASVIVADFNRVKAMPAGYNFEAYRAASSPVLPAEYMTALLRSIITANDAILRAKIAGYDGFPTPAKLALLDMSYNLGGPKLFIQYPLMLAAVEAQHWLTASQQCHRNGPNQARNDWTRDQFLAAA